jgi:hypothetical protein
MRVLAPTDSLLTRSLDVSCPSSLALLTTKPAALHFDLYVVIGHPRPAGLGVYPFLLDPLGL